MSGGPAVTELEAGGRLGPYRLGEVLGEGGVGIVFKAVHEPDGRVVALKVLRDELSADETYRRRFAREGEIAGRLSHPHLVPVLDAGEADGHPYLAARYVEGVSLAELLDEGPLPASAVLRVVAEVATGLDAVHREGLVHRDVKPWNILLDESGTSFLTDFGLAKGAAATVLTRPGYVVGTLDYLSPEVIKGEVAGPARRHLRPRLCDLRVRCRPAAVRRRNLRRDDARDPGGRTVRPRSDRDDLPPDLSFAVLQALAKAPADRPATAAAYALMLRVSARPG